MRALRWPAIVLLCAAAAVRADDSPAELVIERRGQDVVAYAVNRLSGPVEVELNALELVDMANDTALPLRQVLPPRARVRLVGLTALSPAAKQSLRLDATPGPPGKVARDFTMADGEITPTMKLKRRVAQEHFQAEIDALYAD